MMTLTTQPRLYTVPPQGLKTLRERAGARRAAEGERRTVAYDAYDAAAPDAASVAVQAAYLQWGIGSRTAADLGDLTRQLATHAAEAISTHRLVVTAALDGARGTATVSVLALRGRPTRRRVDVSALPAVRERTAACGVRSLAAGPCLYAAMTTRRPTP